MQLPAKTAALLPFTLALCYARAVYQTLDVRDTALFFLSMLCFEFLVTGLNNYQDTKKDGKPLPLPREVAKRLLLVLFALAMAAGLVLGAFTGPVVLVCGALCFAVGVAYSFGPYPLSHLPLGEALSGLFEGLGIPFLVVTINAPNALLGWTLRAGTLTLTFRLPDLLRLGLLCVPCMLCIAGIMLANNICDAEDDLRVGRRTLPSFLGRKNSLLLFSFLYYVAFAAVLLAALLRVIPPYAALALAALIPVQRNLAAFGRVQSKARTFPLSVHNFLWLLLPLIAAEGAAALLAR